MYPSLTMLAPFTFFHLQFLFVRYVISISRFSTSSFRVLKADLYIRETQTQLRAAQDEFANWNSSTQQPGPSGTWIQHLFILKYQYFNELLIFLNFILKISNFLHFVLFFQLRPPRRISSNFQHLKQNCSFN